MGRRLDWSRASWENRYFELERDETSALYKEATRILNEAQRAYEENKVNLERERREAKRLSRAAKMKRRQLRRQAEAGRTGN